MDKLKPEQVAKVNAYKNKLHNTANDVQAIYEQAKHTSQDPSQLFLFKGMHRDLKPRFDTFIGLWDKLEEFFINSGIQDLFPTEEEKNLYQTVKSHYYYACAVYEDHMNPTPNPNATATANTSVLNTALNDSRTVRARLPQINLPQFSGAQSDWPLFRDTFLSLIHDEPSLSNIERFHFLVSCLRGPALSLVKGIPLQEATYDQAWKALKDNFDDKRRLATSYLKTVLNYVPFRNKPTASSIKHLMTTVIESITAFKQIKIEAADDFILTYLVLRCLDPATRKDFERRVADLEFPTFERLVEFLRAEWKSLDLTSEEFRSQPTHSNSSFSSRPPNKRLDATLFADDEASEPRTSSESTKPAYRNKNRNTPSRGCPVCRAEHTLYNCNSFKRSSADERRAKLKNWVGCLNCLSSKHKKEACPSPRRCRTCQQNHHSWLHPSPAEDPSPTKDAKPEAAALTGTSRCGEVILGTALVKIKGSDGVYHTIRLVTDCGSQHSFITRRCVDRLGLPFTPSAPQIAGIGQIPLPQAHGTLTCTLRSRLMSSEFRTEAIVVQDITGHLPHSRLPHEVHTYLSAYELADPTYWKPQEIDFLLGADLFFDLITGAPLQLREDLPKLIPSKLGHIVVGRCSSPTHDIHHTSLFVQTKTDLTSVMNKFWELEELPKTTLMSEEEISCEEHFMATHRRLPSGRYVVALPFKPSIEDLQNPRKQVVSRFLNLEYKLAHRPEFKSDYHQFMEEYRSLGHMQPAQNQTRYLIPHHGVTKLENGKSKLRVVFDASCRTPTGSLNDHLLVGPKLQRDITDIILTFRTFPIALVADIVKMYRQILVRPEDRPFQHIFWRSDPKDKMATMELMTVTYGINSSAYLAMRALQQLAQDEGHRYPQAARVLKESIYVDDIVAGADSIEEALSLQNELIQLLRLGGFELSKWKSNSPELLKNVQSSNELEQLPLSGNEDAGCKILGLQWSSANDMFTFEITTPITPHTKRGILSTIARIYDPLGFLAPVIFKAKALLQDVWQAKCDWDQRVPEAIENNWSSFVGELSALSDVHVHRPVSLPECASYEIVGFSDASQRGYSAVLYLRATSHTKTQIHLLKAKTKLAPTKPISIPRLELCGALLLARLLDSCRLALARLSIQGFSLFTDSTIVLGWLKLPLNTLKVFVAHRVSEILDLTPNCSWQHIASEFNPADCASRGLLPSELVKHELWWTGPDWLSSSSRAWPLGKIDILTTDLPETKFPVPTTLLAEDLPSILDWMSNISSYLKLLRVLSYVLRFIRIIRYHKRESTKNISLKELEDARVLCIQLVQTHYFQNNSSFLSSKYWKSLSPYKDSRGLFRVGGRLEHSSLSYSAKHPIILPNCHFTRLLVSYYHQAYLHIGPTSLQAALQNRFFICSARKVIRSIVRRCVTCQTSAPKSKAPQMGNLPAFRLEEGQVFQHVGVDLGGPFPLKESNRRKAGLGKAYLCLFICMVTKAVHLEIVSRCSTEAFIAALHRFISRRGKPLHIYSDCGTNFIGAASTLRELKSWYHKKDTQQQICNFATGSEIHWHFNPPSAPHFGGLWEAGIKSAKSLMRKNLNGTPLTFEEMSTLFSRIEAVLNSRPLCPVNKDSTSIECLTPGHFLIGRAITGPPERSLLDVKENTLRRWQLIQQRLQNFWVQWRITYLNQLYQRRKWTSSYPNLKENDLIIIKDASLPPTRWPLARVASVHAGQDGVVRVATIRTPNGIYKRPVVKLVPLLLPSNE